ncbi:MAG TPA: bifunctional phosphopantothenoylcysteine decarboxylase/phosphopantothenate--cysteine ligase CoaBC [Woeseiaceae bacterium]|nr:bifunctional phosphopantothenoylcysteine decarboxylase/phosphopantothenate--cysteine ligase CoaBC [Woeseiaceae bacterium]
MSERNIILGVTGSIAAYKSPEIVRRLRERGAAVQVVMTRSAAEFISATSLQAVSGKPVRSSMWDPDAEAAMGHIELARWADLVLVAPATAEILSRLSVGSASDLLTTLCLATEAPLVVAPAMNRVMWAHPAVQANRETLIARGVRILGPGSGDQACGEFGEGRMLDPADIVNAVLQNDQVSDANATVKLLAGRTVMITAGPTREAIDPVRFISNRSSGRMGYALAKAAADAGARVILVSGPVSMAAPEGVECTTVESAQEMFAETHKRIDDVDLFIGAAAISDYRPESAHKQKIKKGAGGLRIDLVKAPDTLASVAKLERRPFTVGFAAETEKLRECAQGKLAAKNLDLIVANQVGEGRGFDCDDNAVEVYWSGGEKSFPMMEKSALAKALIALIVERYRAPDKGDTVPSVAAIRTERAT